VHADKGPLPRRTALLGIERALVGRTAAFVTVSRADLERGARLGILVRDRARVVPNGVAFPPPRSAPGAFRAELGIGAEVPLALHVGRFDVPKDQATLLRALALAAERVPDAVLAVIGSGELEGALRALAAELRLGERVRFVAPRPDLAPAYTDADVFVLSSLWEGLPYVLLEAMAYGVAIASTGVDGIPEAVTDGESGLLVPSADPPALADALARLLTDRTERERLGAFGARTVQDRFQLPRMLDALAGLYREVASGA
jgi:glycosyltransferase involved in cell wall biosynthesis